MILLSASQGAFDKSFKSSKNCLLSASYFIFIVFSWQLWLACLGVVALVDMSMKVNDTHKKKTKMWMKFLIKNKNYFKCLFVVGLKYVFTFGLKYLFTVSVNYLFLVGLNFMFTVGLSYLSLAPIASSPPPHTVLAKVGFSLKRWPHKFVLKRTHHHQLLCP